MKILYVTTIGLTMGFFENLIRELMDEGHTVDIACNENDVKVSECYREWGCRIYQLDCSRSPLSSGNLKAVKELREIVSTNGYDIVHCHTPVAGAVTRLACRKLRKKGLKVFYTAHGFHFYKGAPLKNWVIYYPIEKLCAHFTDVLITINHEDYELAKKKMKAKRVEYVPGVGLDVDKFANAVADRTEKRKELGIPENVFLMLSVGELNENKNHQIVIRALAELKNPDIHYMIAGEGPLKDYLQKTAENSGVAEQVHIPGYRFDVPELYKAADAVVFPSIREGLGLAAVEGMAAGLPLICSDNRGTREFADKDNSIVCKSNDVKAFSDAISWLFTQKDERTVLGNNGRKKAEQFTLSRANRIIKQYYANGEGIHG